MILNRYLEQNRTWAAQQTERDLEFFTRQAIGQQPRLLWNTCRI